MAFETEQAAMQEQLQREEESIEVVMADLRAHQVDLNISEAEINHAYELMVQGSAAHIEGGQYYVTRDSQGGFSFHEKLNQAA